MENKNKTINKRGFTLIEVMVALLMVSIAFMGIYSTTAKYTQQTNQIKEIYTASLIGQEGIEIVRNIRDRNWMTSLTVFPLNSDFSNGLTGYACSGSPLTGGAEANYDSASLTAYNNTHYLSIIGGNGFYKYIASPAGTDVLTSYRRQICIDTADANILHVAVYVYWKGGRSTVIQEDLYNWKW